MGDDKDGGKLGGWFSDINRVLLVLVAGTVLISEVPFHEFRPSRQTRTSPIYAQVDARLWQDPFEAAGTLLDSAAPSGDPVPGHGERFADALREKTRPFGANALNVVALMLPGGPYFEESEIRRRLRYSVLSGFDAARRYLPEDPQHVQFLDVCRPERSDGRIEKYKSLCKDPRRGKIVYEWLVYKPVEFLSDAGSNAPAAAGSLRRYAPILVLYLNNDLFHGNPRELLQQTLGALKSMGARGVAPGMAPPDPAPDDGAAIQPQATGLPRCHEPQHEPVGQKRWNISLLGPWDSDVLQDLVVEVTSATPGPECTPDGGVDGTKLRWYSPNASLQDARLVPQRAPHRTLSDLFRAHDLPFLRVLSSDQKLADAASDELALRAITAGRENRILLLGEWDTLYGWHLPGTFAEALIRREGTKCPRKASSGEQGSRQNSEDVYDDDVQCVFQYSYLRGLDGEKARSRDRSDKEARDTGDPGSDAGSARRLEDADGDSQFDYLRRLALRLSDLDRQIRERTENNAAHPIKAIGVLGSDPYDKLLVLEAMHERFPDALFFTNGVDARFLHPDKNRWARNLVMLSGFGLELRRELQRDVPPFRDSAQTAYFLATEMALASIDDASLAQPDVLGSGAIPASHGSPDEVCPNAWCLGPRWHRWLASGEQSDIDSLIGRPRIHEVGRTRMFELGARASEPPGTDGEERSGQPDVHPPLRPTAWPGGVGVLGAALMILCLIIVKPARDFLCTAGGFYLCLLITVVGIGGAVLVATTQTMPRGIGLWMLMLGLGLLYALVMAMIVLRDEARSQRTTVDQSDWYWPAGAVLLLATYIGLWTAVKPGQGMLDGGEIYALFEGVSMWPTEFVRLMAFILSSYFIIEVCRLPNHFTVWMEHHFKLPQLTEMRTRCRAFDRFAARCFPREAQWRGRWVGIKDWVFGKPDPEGPNVRLAARLEEFPVLNDWLAWRSTPRRLLSGILLAVVYYVFATSLFKAFGFPRLPARGESILFLDQLLMRGFLVPSFTLLLMLVVDAVWTAVRLLNRLFPDEGDRGEAIRWPDETLQAYADKFLLDANEMGPWVGMRFVEELTQRLYRIIGYPLIIALLLVIARSNINDNYVMPIAFKIVIATSVVLLFASDHFLKNAADGVRKRALRQLRARVTQCQGNETGVRLERLIGMIEQTDEVVYQSFTQRPIFRGSLLLLAALLADFADYSTLASKLF